MDPSPVQYQTYGGPWSNYVLEALAVIFLGLAIFLPSFMNLLLLIAPRFYRTHLERVDDSDMLVSMARGLRITFVFMAIVAVLFVLRWHSL